MTQKPLILVVGGAGYIGSHMVLLLEEAGFETIVLDNLSTGHRDAIFSQTKIVGNLGDRTLLKNIFTTYPITAVMHFASKIEVKESVQFPLKYYQHNVYDTLTLLDVMLAAGVKNFIFSSSAAVYGEPAYLPIDENHPLNPINPYGRSKKIIEDVIVDLSQEEDLRYVIFRYFNVSGADFLQRTGERHEPESHLIPLALEAAIKNKTLMLYGDDYQTKDGTCVRDYIHVLDVCEAHLLGLKHLLNGNENIICNLGAGCGYSVKDIITTIEKITKKTIKVDILSKREGDPAVLLSDINKANKLLKWQPKFSLLKKIIRDAFQFMQKDRNQK